jgi:hypothetical protein
MKKQRRRGQPVCATLGESYGKIDADDVHERYSHLSSISRLPDEQENYSIVAFRLQPKEDETLLTLTLSNFPTESIYQHLAFYWNVTLETLKKMIEERRNVT